MNFTGKLSALIAVALLAPANALAFFDHGDAGQEVFSFMRTFDSPRNAALEKSAAANPSTDPSITQLNPAALKLPEGTDRIASMHWQTGEFADNQGTISYTTHFNTLLYQISYNWLDYGTIEGYDEFGESTGVDYEPFSQLVTATVAFPLKHFQFGTTIKFASDRLAEEEGDRTAFGLAFDWGIAWQSASKIFGLALTARDMGCILRDYVDDDENDHYPMSQVISVAGYADKKTGSVKRNQVLSEQRAKVVFDYLVSLGVPADKLETSANGGVDPIFFNNDVLSRTVILRPKK